MEAKAAFRDSDGETVSSSDVQIKEMEFNGVKEFCLQISNDPCAQFWLEKNQLVSLSKFVRSDETAAFTLPSGEDPESIISGVKSFMVPVGDEYSKKIGFTKT